MGLFTQCFCCEAWKNKYHQYRKQPSPRTAYLPGNIEKSHFVYSPKLSLREDYIFRPSIQQLAQTFAVENLQIDKPIGLPLSSCYLDLPHISKPRPESSNPRPESSKPRPESPKPPPESPKPRPESLKPRPESLKPRPESLKPRPESSKPRPESPKPGTGSLKPAKDIVGPKETKLIKVKPAKESMCLVKEYYPVIDDKQLTDLSQVVDHYSTEEEEFKKSSSLLLDNSNNNVCAGISTITLQESSCEPQPHPRPVAMFCVTRDEAWREQLISDKKLQNKKKTKKDKITYTNIETFVEPMDEEIKKKNKNIFKKLLHKKYSVPDSDRIGTSKLNMSYDIDMSSSMLDCAKYYSLLAEQ